MRVNIFNGFFLAEIDINKFFFRYTYKFAKFLNFKHIDQFGINKTLFNLIFIFYHLSFVKLLNLKEVY